MCAQNWTKLETNCCKKSNILQQFFCTQKRERKWQKWQSETAPIRCNFISAMMSSTSSTPSSKHPAWRVCLRSCSSFSVISCTFCFSVCHCISSICLFFAWKRQPLLTALTQLRYSLISLLLLPWFVLISAMYSCLLSAPVSVNVFCK